MRSLVILAGLLVVLGMGYCQAAEHPGAGLEHPGAALATETSGAVTAVDAEAGEVTIKTAEGEEKVLAVTEDTEITKGGDEITLADIVAGDSVTATEEDGTVTSLVVE